MDHSASAYETWPLAYIAFKAIVCVLLLALPFAAFFGFFENRKDGNYSFRTKRFLAVIVCLAALSFVSGIVNDLGIASMMIGSSQESEFKVLSSRATTEFRIRSEAAMFPEVLTDQAAACYRAAFSNYIEDQWNKRVHDESCNGKEHVCANNETDYYNKLLKTYPRQNWANTIDATRTVLGSIWMTAADMFKLTRRLQHTPNKDGSIPEPPDQQTLANYQHYLTDCSSLKPLSWTMPGQDLLTVHPYMCLWSCQ